MKRFVLIIGAILLGLALRAQSMTYTCRYWFDQNDAQAVTTTFSENTWQVEWDVGTLTKGLHTLHVQAADTSSAWCSPLSYMFLKLSPTEPLLDTVDMSNLIYHCWFDQDDAHQQTGALGNGIFMFDVSDLEEGLHSVNIMLEGSTLTSTQNYMFIKVAQQAPLIDPIDMSHLVYHCWFDQDYENRVVDSVSTGSFLLDVSDLDEGLHSVNIMLVGEALTSVQNYLFIKVAQQAPLIEPIDMSHLVYHCWFDEDYENRVTDSISNGIILLDVENIGDGLHTVHILLEGEALTSTLTYMFLKKPQQQDFGIAKWQYYLNGDVSQIHTTEISPVIDTLDIITLLPVETWPVRSSCFHFHPNGEEPYLNAKNEITFLFWSNDDHLLKKSEFYVDYQVTETIEADTLERNSTVCIAAPRDNFIKWYRLPLEYGDTVAFKADKACTMQLFSPSGEEVYTATAGEALVFGGCHAYEDGDYYLAVHDVTGSGDEVCLTNVFVHKYAILAYDVHLVGNGGCSTITFQGNGFNSLLDAYLVNAQNDTIQRLDIGHESNTTTTVTFNFYEVNLGVYDAVFQFYDETMHVNGALEVEEPTPILLTNSVSYPHVFMSGRPVTYSYTITNHGNMTAYGIPIYVFISTLNTENVTNVKLKGLKLPSLIDGISTDSLSEAEISELRRLSDNMGDLHHFFALNSVDENTGDSINILSNYFFLNIAPLESKTLDIVITATAGLHNPLNVWVTVPNDTVQPLILSERGIRDQYCCVKDKMECVLNIVADVSGLLSTFGIGGAGAMITNCVTSSLSALSSTIGYWVCREEGDPLPFDLNSMAGNTNSAVNLIMSCFKKVPEAFEQLMALLEGKGFAGLRDALGIVQDVSDCVNAFTQAKPDCPPGNEGGGASEGGTSYDPNDIRGYLSESSSHYIRQEIQNVQYEIEFENDTTLATAAAHTIIVRDTLDDTKFDLYSLAARSVTIGDKRLELNGEQTFARTLDLRPEIYVIAQVNQDYDPTTGIIQWTIQSLDPMTMEPTDDPYQGVLPVNYFGDGVGFIDYSIDIKETFADGTEISNRAGIIFDQEDVIMTPIWTNIVDAVKPTSYIEEVTPMADSLNFVFVSQDNRSGVWYHTLYYRNDSTDQQWQVRKTHIFENSFMLHLEDLQTTEYLVMAVDSAGNHEDKLFNAEYVFGFDSLEYYTLTLESDGCGEVNGAGTYLAGSYVVIEAIPDVDCQFEQWSDGNTDNPRTIELVQDTTFVAQFTSDQIDVTQISDLAAGWSWWSTYVEQNGIDGLTMLEEGLGSNGYQIKSQTDFVTNYGTMWFGMLGSITNEETYMINNTSICQIEMTGAPVTPSDHPITVSSGWNWIGYPCTNTMSVSEAFSGYTPANGDQVKSQSDYAMYFNGMWIGQLINIAPGTGLMYMSNNAAPTTLFYPDGGRNTEVTTSAKATHWTNDIHAYPHNMTVMAVVELDDVELTTDNYELAAFDANGECRGSAKLTYVEPLNRYVAFLTIAGNDAVELGFRLYDAETGTEYYDAEESLSFAVNATVGEPEDVFVVHFRGTTGMDELASSVQVYPNPVNGGEQFSIGVNAESKAPVRVEIVNALGVETLRATSTQMPAMLTASSVAGVYTLRITVEGKGTLVRKLVVR